MRLVTFALLLAGRVVAAPLTRDAVGVVETEPGTVAGRVTAPGGRAVAGAEVLLFVRGRFGDRVVIETAETDADGRFALGRRYRRVEPNTGPNWVFAIDHPDWALTVIARRELTEPVELRVEPPRVVRLLARHAGRPVAGVVVRPNFVDGQTLPREVALRMGATTDPQGLCHLRRCPRRLEGVEVEDERFVRTSLERYRLPNLPPVGNALVLELELGGAVSGRLIDAVTGAPVAETQVFAHPLDVGEGGTSTVTDAAGVYRITGLVAGTHNVAARLSPALRTERTCAAHAEVLVGAGETVALPDLTLIPGVLVRGRLVPEAGTAVPPEVPVVIHGPANPRSASFLEQVATDAEGRFTVRLPPGWNHFRAGGGQGGPTAGPLEVLVPDQPEFVLDLALRPADQPQPPVAVQVVGADGQPVPQAHVLVVPLLRRSWPLITRTNAGGTAFLPSHLAGERAELWAWYEESAAEAIALYRPDDPNTLVLRLTAGVRRVRGFAYGPDEAPLAELPVRLMARLDDNWVGLIETRTDQLGYFELVLPPFDAELRAAAYSRVEPLHDSMENSSPVFWLGDDDTGLGDLVIDPARLGSGRIRSPAPPPPAATRSPAGPS